MQQPALSECVPAGQAHLTFRIMGLLGRNAECHRHHCFKLEDIRNVIDERLWLARMYEAYSRRITGRQNGCLADAVERQDVADDRQRFGTSPLPHSL